MRSATVIIPTLNEEDNIDPLLDQLTQISVENCTLEILFADDQSTDQTIQKIQQWQKRIANISILQRQEKPDLAKSIIEGAMSCSSDFIVVMDADLSHPIRKIPELLKPLLLGTHDVTVGSRYVKNGGISNWPVHRRLLSWLGGLPARMLTDIKDTTSGFFACKRNCFKNISPDAKGYKILLELLASGLDQFRATEVPIVFTDRVQGQSKLSSKQLIEYFQRLIELSGGRSSPTTAKRFLSVGILGVIIDALTFHLLLDIGWTISSAHITSFFLAATSNYFFNSIWSFEYNHHSLRSWITKAVKFIYFGLIALIIRGGVLAILINLLGVSPALAIYPAILAVAVINYFAASYIVFPSDDHHSGAALSIYWRIVSVATIGFMLVLRFLYLGTTELIPDEAYYWNYKEYLDFGYLDHPPLLAWGLWLSTSIFGDTEFGVRIVSFICGLGVIVAMFRLTSLLFDRTSAYIAAFLVSVFPFTVATGFLVTTDAPLMLFWCAGLYFLAKIVTKESTYAWIGLGACIGLGMLSKYSVALLGLCIIVFITLDRSSRFWWKRPIIYISGFIAVILFLPVIYWNAQHDWSSFIFQTTRRLDRLTEFSTHYLLLHIVILLSPIGVYLYLKSLINIKDLVSAYTNNSNSSIYLRYIHYFLIFTFVPLSIYLYFSLSHYPRFHWSAPVWLAIAPLAAYALSPTSKFLSAGNYLAKYTIYTAALLCLFYGTLLHYAALGLPLNTPVRFSEHYFWQQTAQYVHQLEKNVVDTSGQTPLIVGLSKWSVASALRFYDVDKEVDNIVSRNAIGRPATMYEQWTQPKQWAGQPVIFIALNPNDLVSVDLETHTKGLQPPQKFIISLNNNKLRYIHYRIADHYLP